MRVAEFTAGAAMTYLHRSWARLYRADEHATAYQSPLWLTAWARHRAPGREPFIVSVHDHRGPVAALALTRHVDSDGRRRITALSAPAAECIRPLGPGAEHPAVAAALAGHLHHLADDRTEVYLPDLPADSALARHAQRLWSGSCTQTPYATVPLPLDLTGLSRSTRRDHQRRRRALHALGDRVTYHRTHSKEQLLAAYRVLEQLHHQRNADRPPTGALTANASLPWPAVLSSCAPMAFIATLKLDGQAVAAQLCLHHGRHAYSLLAGMDPRHRALAPGHTLLRLLAEDLTATGFTALDLGRTTADPGQRAYKAAYGASWRLSTSVSTQAASSLPAAREPLCRSTPAAGEPPPPGGAPR
ncbi:GNAT family N-acetyltransferase [Streptomyces sp. NPDC059994]|uniref:GNAT family N-acetyltransferase n=1 Tax=Streptomyces sp. NPDC059994 TaxID=3347029 RepID=UPI0036D1FB53